MRGTKTTLLLSFILSASSVEAQDSIPWGSGEVKGWKVAVDTTLGNGCFIATVFDGDTVLRLGIDATDYSYYFMIGDPDWQSLEDGKEYDLEFHMGRKTPWEALATGLRMGDLPTLVVSSGEFSFIDEFASQRNIRVNFEGNQIANLSLAGSYAAVTEMVACQVAMGEGASSPAQNTSDPFRKPSGKDPFR